jgi:ParB/RepB/Spo0J family partition protein
MSDTVFDRTLDRLPIALIDAPELDVRVKRNDDELDELGIDIARRGQIDPIHVFVNGDRYEAVDGYSRLLAMRRQGLITVQAFVYPTKTIALEGVKYAANVFRIEMTPADEAKAFYELFSNECERDIERVARLVGKTIGYVDARLQLAMGDDLIFAAVRDKKIKLGVAECFNKIDKADWRHYYLKLAIESGGITVAIAERWLGEYRGNHADRKHEESPAPVTPAPIVADAHDPFACEVCRESSAEPVILISVHPSCRQAILRKMIDAYHGVPSTP